MAGDSKKPVTKPNLQKGEIFERFFASLPETGVQEWNWAECKRVQHALRPCWLIHGLRAIMMDRLHKRMWQLRKEGKNE